MDFGPLVRFLDVGATYWFELTTSIAGMRLHRRKKSFLALGRTVVPFGVAQQHDLALSAHGFDQPLAAKLSALDVVGGDEADVVVALQPRVEDHDRNLLAHGVVDRPNQRGFIERRDARCRTRRG